MEVFYPYTFRISIFVWRRWLLTTVAILLASPAKDHKAGSPSNTRLKSDIFPTLAETGISQGTRTFLHPYVFFAAFRAALETLEALHTQYFDVLSCIPVSSIEFCILFSIGRRTYWPEERTPSRRRLHPLPFFLLTFIVVVIDQAIACRNKYYNHFYHEFWHIRSHFGCFTFNTTAQITIFIHTRGLYRLSISKH